MLEIVAPLGSLEAASSARMALDLLARERGGAIAEVKLYGAAIAVASLERRLRNRGAFDIEGDGFAVQMASIADHRLIFVEVTGVADDGELAWVEEVGRRARLISARVYDAEYEHWQNAADPLLYTAVGRSMAGLPMKSNGLPPPLDKMVVDTSRNPGRRILRDGHIEAIGPRMWLGAEFFAQVPDSDRRAVLDAPGLRVTERPDGLTEILAREPRFVDAGSAEEQHRLRRLLFPSTAGR